MSNLWQQYQANKTARTGMYFPREGAADLGVSEGALMADAPDTVFLGGDLHELVRQLHRLGEVQCVVRNDVCVHEKQGVYENVRLSAETGIVLNIGGIDLRLFPTRWQHALAVTQASHGSISRSIQFYDEFGTALQKVFMRDESRLPEWHALIAAFRSEARPEFVQAELPPVAVPPAPDAEQQTAFQQAWQGLEDVHHFGALIERFGLDRPAAYRAAPEGAAKQISNESWQHALETVRDQAIEVMIFAGNRGLVQIQTGRVHNVVRARGYLNVLDGKEEGFSMHLKDDEIAETWVVRRPVRDGFVSCIEGFDSRRRTVIQMFGRRKEGQTELAAWTALTDKLLNS